MKPYYATLRIRATGTVLTQSFDSLLSRSLFIIAVVGHGVDVVALGEN